MTADGSGAVWRVSEEVFQPETLTGLMMLLPQKCIKGRQLRENKENQSPLMLRVLLPRFLISPPCF